MERQNFKHFRCISQFAFSSCRAAAGAGPEAGKELPSGTTFAEVAFPLKNNTLEPKAAAEPFGDQGAGRCLEVKGTGLFQPCPQRYPPPHPCAPAHWCKRFIGVIQALHPLLVFFPDPPKWLGGF